jgi:hypothetical protein
MSEKVDVSAKGDKSAESSGESSGESSVDLVPQPHGGALLRGNPTAMRKSDNRGGRPPDEFKRRMAEIASSDAALAYLDECIRGEHGPKAAASARVFAAERGYGRVPAAVELSGPGGAPIPTEIIVTRRIVE